MPLFKAVWGARPVRQGPWLILLSHTPANPPKGIPACLLFASILLFLMKLPLYAQTPTPTLPACVTSIGWNLAGNATIDTSSQMVTLTDNNPNGGEGGAAWTFPST